MRRGGDPLLFWAPSLTTVVSLDSDCASSMKKGPKFKLLVGTWSAVSRVRISLNQFTYSPIVTIT